MKFVCLVLLFKSASSLQFYQLGESELNNLIKRPNSFSQSLTKDYFDKDPFSTSPGDYGIHDIREVQDAI